MQPCIDEQNKLYFVDGLHPNDAGHEKLAKIISHFFETQLP
jgi:lysophospholipase L1-like esterase